MATENDTVSTDAIGTLVVVLAVAVVAVGLAVTAMVRSEQSDLALSREAQANLRPIRELRASQLGELNAAPSWVNRDKGTVTIPIERAMELVLEQARSSQTIPATATPVSPQDLRSANAASSGSVAGRLSNEDGSRSSQPEAPAGKTPP